MNLKTKGLACALVMLLLSGCSNSEPESDSSPSEAATGVYEFKTPAYGSEGELTIRLPKDLKEVAPETEELLVTSVTAMARELESLKYCAVDFAVTYADGALDELKKPRMTRDEWDKENQETLANDLRAELGAATVEEYIAEYQSAFGTQPSEVDIADFESELAWVIDSHGGGAEGDYVETSEMENVVISLTGSYSESSIRDLDDLDPSDPVTGTYVSDDFRTVTSVQTCAESGTDDSTAKEFNFPYIGASSEREAFADFSFTVMKDGSLTIVESWIAAYKLDANGSWLAK